MGLFLILFSLGLASLFFGLLDNLNCSISRIILIILAVVLIFYSGLSLEHVFHSKFPSALDVYRGKTTLKIKTEVVDSIVTHKDSTVVWKDKY